MTWALILHFTFAPPGAAPQISQTTAGLMADRDACIIAGSGMALILEAANPGLTVRFACLQQGVGA